MSTVLSRKTTSVESIINTLNGVTLPLAGPPDLDPLIDSIGESRFVLLGEASHGTSDYYTWRAVITKRLIEEKGFSFIAVEGDWPDCYKINRYIKGYNGSGRNAVEVLDQFDRWPTWMWANWEIAALAEWLKQHNKDFVDERKIGFYGLDVYSLWDSMYSIISYLKRTHPEAVATATRALRCFERFGESPEDYAYAAAFVPESCEDEVISMLKDISSRIKLYADDREAAFDAEQNALIAVEAEKYYRTMIRGGANSWNLRDTHMADTLDRLMDFHGSDAKAIVWEHNTHIGDARATDMTMEGEINVGQLVRERYGNQDAVLIGFGSYEGTVIAAREWGAQMEVMQVPPAEETSWEDIFHRSSAENQMLMLRDVEGMEEFNEPRGHRAIGVVYRPAFERYGNYVPTILPKRYDTFIYLDYTEALHPLHIEPVGVRKVPETYPWGI
jgi:erythromycin esterase